MCALHVNGALVTVLLTGKQALHRTKRPTLPRETQAQERLDEHPSKTSNAGRRSSLLPKRLASTTHIDQPVIQPETPARPALRVPSPSKLHQGPLQGSSSVKQLEGYPSRRTISHQRAPSKTTQLKQSLHGIQAESSSSVHSFISRDTPTTIDQPSRPLRVRTQTQQADPPQDMQRVPSRRNHQDQISTKLTYAKVPEKAARTPANAAAKLQRPTFSTLQQHYSPKKTNPKDAGNVVQEATAPRLQFPQYSRGVLESKLELLHLHMMHRSSGTVQKQWQDSAEQSYKRQFTDLIKIDSDLDERELEHLEQLNANAIMAWCSGSENATIERKIQILSATIEEAWNASRPTGKYTLVIQAFEHWYARASQVQSQRLGNESVAQDHIDVLEGLGDGWKAEASSMHSRILHAADGLLGLGEVQHQSDLARCVTVLFEMLKNMLEELELVQLIENQIVQQEKVWVESSINKIASGLRDGPSMALTSTHRRR